ncbi:MAG TPA: hypothetical protein VIM81_21155 [Gammaproteobacteria bacterium]
MAHSPHSTIDRLLIEASFSSLASRLIRLVPPFSLFLLSEQLVQPLPLFGRKPQNLIEDFLNRCHLLKHV